MANLWNHRSHRCIHHRHKYCSNCSDADCVNNEKKYMIKGKIQNSDNSMKN